MRNYVFIRLVTTRIFRVRRRYSWNIYNLKRPVHILINPVNSRCSTATRVILTKQTFNVFSKRGLLYFRRFAVCVCTLMLAGYISGVNKR